MAVYTVSSGQIRTDSVSTGDTVIINSGGTFANAKVNSAAYVSNAGTITGINLLSGATVTITKGGNGSNNGVAAGATVIVASSASFYGGNVIRGVAIASGAAASVNGYIQSGGTALSVSGGTVFYATVDSGGVALTSSGGSFLSTYINSSGSGVIGRGGSAQDTYVASGGTLFNGGIESNTTLDSGTYVLLSGGTLPANSNGTVNGSGYLQIASGAILSGGKANSTVAVQVLSGGVASGTTATSGSAAFTVSSGGTGINNTNLGADGGVTILSGGTEIVTSGALVGHQTIAAGGTEIIQAGGTASGGNQVYGTVSAFGSNAYFNGFVLSGGKVVVASGGAAYAAYGGQGATVSALSGGVLSAGNLSSGAAATVFSGGTATGVSIASDAALTVVSGGKISGNLWISGTAAVTIPTDAGGGVVLTTDSSSVTISGKTSPSTVISGFNGSNSTATDTVKLADIQQSDVTGVSYPDLNHVTLTLKNNLPITLNIINVRNFGYTLASDSKGNLIYEVCFLSGVEIATPNGNCLVEDFKPGDAITTFVDGIEQSDLVIWVGKATCQVRADLSDDEAGYPVVVARGALGNDLPTRDLRVTSEHALYLDGKFIPVRMLVNGQSIYYDKDVLSYDYYHIETASHAVICANGSLTESYLDTGNRARFDPRGNVRVLTHEKKTGLCHAAAELCVDREFVEPIYKKICSLSVSHPRKSYSTSRLLTDDPNLRLITDRGDIILPRVSQTGQYVFRIPPLVQNIRIVSYASRPFDTIGPFVDDRRRLGILIGDIMLYDAFCTYSITDHKENASLSGWYETGSSRWTDGNAALQIRDHATENFSVLAINVLAAGPYLVDEQYHDWNTERCCDTTWRRLGQA